MMAVVFATRLAVIRVLATIRGVDGHKGRTLQSRIGWLALGFMFSVTFADGLVC